MYTPNDDRKDEGYSKWNYSEPDKTEDNSGEYRLRRDEIPKPSYTDASYISAEEVNSPPQYYTPVSQERSRKEKKTRSKKTSGFSLAGVIAMCLVCAIIGGIAGGTVGFITAGQEMEQSDSMAGSPEEAAPTVNPTTPASPISTSTGTEALSGNEIYNLACPQTVGINSEVTTTNIFGQQSTSATSGSGFIIRSNGYIVTNYHVIELAVTNNLDINVMLHDGESYIADVIGYEQENDLAVLKIDAEGLPTAVFGNSDDIQVGESVYAVGNPLGELSYTMTTGNVSALGREITTEDQYSYGNYKNTISMFQFDAAVNSGNSGGPLYNDRGEVIGIVTAKYSSSGVEGLGFAIPSNDAAYIVNEFIEKGYISGKPDFGIRVDTVDSSVARYYNMVEGAYVFSMDSEGAAAAAGLEVGDIIVKLDDYEISTVGDLRGAKKNYKAGDEVSIVVYRQGEYVELSLVFDEEPREERTYDEGVSDDELMATPQPSVPDGFSNFFG